MSGAPVSFDSMETLVPKRKQQGFVLICILLYLLIKIDVLHLMIVAVRHCSIFAFKPTAGSETLRRSKIHAVCNFLVFLIPTSPKSSKNLIGRLSYGNSRTPWNFLAVWWHSPKKTQIYVKCSFSVLQRDFRIILGSLKPHGSPCITECVYSTGGRFSKGRRKVFQHMHQRLTLGVLVYFIPIESRRRCNEKHSADPKKIFK